MSDDDAKDNIEESATQIVLIWKPSLFYHAAADTTSLIFVYSYISMLVFCIVHYMNQHQS